MARILLLDVMSTLVYDPFYREMPAFFDMTLDQLLREKHATAWLEFEFGRWTEEQFLTNFFTDGRTFDHDAFRQMTFSTYRWLDGMKELISELVAAGVPMHIVSNYPNWYRALDERLGLSHLLPWTFVSCDWGLRKPDPRVFGRLLTHLGAQAADCVFVDDNGANCDSAQNFGLTAWRFRNSDSLREELVQAGFLAAK